MNRLVLIPMLALLGACASTTPNYDARFGDAVREAKLKMTINPAPSVAATDAGMDGRAAREAMAVYQGTFKAPPPAVNVINIGGQIGGSPR